MSNYTVHQYFELSKRIKQREPIYKGLERTTQRRETLEEVCDHNWRTIGSVSRKLVHELAAIDAEARDLSMQDVQSAQDQGEIEEELFCTAEESEEYFRKLWGH